MLDRTKRFDNFKHHQFFQVDFDIID